MIFGTVIEATHPDAAHLKVVTISGKEIRNVTAIDLGEPRRIRQVIERPNGATVTNLDGQPVQVWVDAPFVVVDRRTGREWLG